MTQNPDKKMLKDMSDAEKGAILVALWKGRVQHFIGGFIRDWRSEDDGNLHPRGIYRIRPEPVRMPSVDWSQVGEAVNHIARDEDGGVWAYSHAPNLHVVHWKIGPGVIDRRITPKADELFPSYDPGTCDWKDSLISRPGHEE